MKSDFPPLAVLSEGLQAQRGSARGPVQGGGAAGTPRWRQNWDEVGSPDRRKIAIPSGAAAEDPPAGNEQREGEGSAETAGE